MVEDVSEGWFVCSFLAHVYHNTHVENSEFELKNEGFEDEGSFSTGWFLGSKWIFPLVKHAGISEIGSIGFGLFIYLDEFS